MAIFRTCSLAGLASAALCWGMTAAHAVPLDELAGPLQFKFTGVSTQQNLHGGQPPAVADGFEDTWVLGSITSITQGLNNLWTPNETNQSLTVMIYGIADDRIEVDAGGDGVDIFSSGATNGPSADGNIHIDVWLDDAPALGGTEASLAAGPGGRTGYGSYDNFTDGQLWLSMIAVPGVLPGEPGISIFQNSTSATSPATGDGSFYAEIIGGLASEMFDTDTFTTELGTTADAFAQFDFVATSVTDVGNPFFGCGNGPVTLNCWENIVNDPVRTYAETPTQIPVPAPLALVSLGLLMLAGLNRPRN